MSSALDSSASSKLNANPIGFNPCGRIGTDARVIELWLIAYKPGYVV